MTPLTSQRLVAYFIEARNLNGVEPFTCFKATLEAIAQGHPNSKINGLMPWCFQKEE
jgi:transposase